MKHKFLEPIKLGNQEVKNRVVYIAMAKALSGFDGKPSNKDYAYLASVARGGPGIVIPGAMIVDGEWPSQMPMAARIHDDAFLPRLSKIARVIHENGAKAVFQLWHPGLVDYSGGNPPSINDISVEHIHSIQVKYKDAAARAIRAGADGVEFQMCHTYLGNQFISPLWNKRTDEYGCDTIENQVRFCVETIELLREAIGPDKILAVKLQGFDFPSGEGGADGDGINPEMAAKIAPYVEKAGADFITVSAGGALTGRDDIMTGDVHRAEGWKVDACAIVKKAVSIPVCASGNIRHPSYVDEIMSEGKCDMVGMGRGMFAERDWVNKCAQGREDELRYCISCMNCWNSNPFSSDQSNCTVNPFATRELAWRPLKVDGDGRVVAIVGAGPAGMEAAVTLKQRGFEPVVFEKTGRIGGNIHIAEKPPEKDKFHWAITYYENMAKKLGIDVRLNTEATAEMILTMDPYSILIASGSKVSSIPVEGLEGENVIQSRDILDKEMKFAGKNAVVIGGGITGLETALYLHAQGNHVNVVDFAPMFPLNQMSGDPRFMMEAALDTKRCIAKGIALNYENKVLKYADGVLHLESVKTGEKTELCADLVVLSVGVTPDDALYKELMASDHGSVWKVGDVNICSKIVNAVQAGSKFAYALS